MSVKVLHDFQIFWSGKSASICELKFKDVSKDNPSQRYQWVLIHENRRTELEFIEHRGDERILRCGLTEIRINPIQGDTLIIVDPKFSSESHLEMCKRV